MLGVSPRTLQNWRAWAREGGARRRPPGRPRRYTHEDRWRALWAVARESRKQGRRAGWPSIKKALGKSVPTRLVQEMLGALKRRRRQREDHRRRARRRHVIVHVKGALWAADATHLDRTQNGGEVKAMVVREVATVKVLEAAVGMPASGNDVVASLERAAEAAGEWPIVLASDNGAEYVSREVGQCLQSHRVVHLRNATHTPQHNAWAERAIGELKDQAEAERVAECEDVFESWQARMRKAQRRLNENRLRASRGYRTAEQLDKMTEPGTLEPLRERFFASAREAAARAVLGARGARAKRLAEREAIFSTMQQFGLITQTRGDARAPAVLCEAIT
jgi:transposase InsO family protein